ncbi:hypothetical protein ACNOYE_16630 [Nannocystaceae bacterium ST9]
MRRGFPPTSFSTGLAHAPSPEPSPELADAELEARLEQLDRTLTKIAEVPDEWLLARRVECREGSRDPELGAAIQAEGRLLRASLRSILASSTLAELPAARRREPALRARIEALAPEADFAVLGTLERLHMLAPEQLRALDQLAAEPGFVDRAARDVDAMAAQLGVPNERRRQLARMVEHVLWKLDRQSLSQLIAELLAQLEGAIDKWAARLPELGPVPALAGGLPSALLSEMDESAPGSSPPDPQAHAAPSTALAPVEITLKRIDNEAGVYWSRLGRRVTASGVGLSLLGLGIGMLEFLPGAFTVTGGVVLLVVGSVLWIYGAIKR